MSGWSETYSPISSRSQFSCSRRSRRDAGRQLDLLGHAAGAPKEAQLPGLGGAEVAGADREDPVDRFEQRQARAEAVQRAHLDQAFQRALAHLAQVHPAGEIVQVAEGRLRAGLDDQIDRPLPDVLDRAQPKADGGLARPGRSSMVKSQPLALTSGGRTSMPIDRQSAT